MSRLASARDRSPADLESYAPTLFRGNDSGEMARLVALLEGPAVTAVHDTIASQLAELAETRSPERKLSPEEIQAFVRQELGQQSLEEYGTWVHYPWSGRVVHVLPEAEYRELRTSRNRNKITAEEQALLRGLRLGIVGLSVGQATAVTLALEEIGGTYVLADFDRLELSNMNRLRAGVHSIGVNKALLTAREIYEINPYARVEAFPDGINDRNIEAFLGGERRLDILFEECDDLEMKIRLRERARAQRIPVLMETSDRGMIDIERFDLEPSRPVLHGLIGDVPADALKGLTTYEKVPFVLRIIGAETMSGRMAASLIDIETTLKTWPQLASNVALGGALNADVGRRVALGQFNRSGRYYVDLDRAINNDVDGSVALGAADHEPAPARSGDDGALPTLGSFTGNLSDAQISGLVRYAISAPSGGNCQPWRFVYRCERLECYFDRERSKTYLDFANTASYLAIGAAVENLCLAAQRMGLGCELNVFPREAEPDLVCSVGFNRSLASNSDDDALADFIGTRVTNRKLGGRSPLTASETDMLGATARAAGAELTLIVEPDRLRALGEIIARGERLRLLNGRMHHEMMDEVRWNARDVAETRDGLDVETLELTATDLAGMRLVSTWTLMDLVGKLGLGRGLERPSRKSIASASAVGLLRARGKDRRDWFQGGRALERLWLRSTAMSLAFQPMTPLLYLFARLEAGAASELNSGERRELEELRRQFDEVFPPSIGADLMLFRVSHAAPPTARSLRRPVEAVLRIERD